MSLNFFFSFFFLILLWVFFLSVFHRFFFQCHPLIFDWFLIGFHDMF
jgi:hypothetical protein